MSGLGEGCRECRLRCLVHAEPGRAQPLVVRTSSIRIKGFSVLVFLRHWMIFPGMAPTYVRLGAEQSRSG